MLHMTGLIWELHASSDEGGAAASWLVRLTLEWVAWVWALALFLGKTLNSHGASHNPSA